MYPYARNNPLLYTDPNGLMYRVCGDMETFDGTVGSCGTMSDSAFFDFIDSDVVVAVTGDPEELNETGWIYYRDGESLGELHYWHMWNDNAGVSLQRDIEQGEVAGRGRSRGATIGPPRKPMPRSETRLPCAGGVIVATGAVPNALEQIHIRGSGETLQWRTPNGRWYPARWEGTPPAARGGIVGAGKAARSVGRSFAFVGVGLNLGLAYGHARNGDYGEMALSAVDAGVSLLSTGGPLGLALSIGWGVGRLAEPC
jgi:hypothetical protein